MMRKTYFGTKQAEAGQVEFCITLLLGIVFELRGNASHHPEEAPHSKARLTALACWELSARPPHGLTGLDLHGGTRRGPCKLLSWCRLLGNLFDEPTHPLLLFLLGNSQQQQVLGRGHVIIDFAGCNNVLFFVHVVLVAFDVAPPTLQRRWWLEHIPQWLSACFTVSGKVVHCREELVAFVADVAGLLSKRKRLLTFLFALTLIGVKYLKNPRNFFGISPIHVCLSNRPHVE